LGIGLNNPSARVDIKGVGTTSATTALSVANSAGTFALQVLDDSRVILGNSSDLAVYSGSAITVRYAMSIGSTSLPTAQLQVKGSGSTSATTSLLVHNSAGAEVMRMRDDGVTKFLGGAARIEATYIWMNSGQLDVPTIYNAGTMYLTPTGNVFGSASRIASALLQVDSTTQGFLPPRMTTTQKNAIATPAAGLVVYDNTTNKLCCYNGSTWNDLF
jgi:hypothetical protein